MVFIQVSFLLVFIFTYSITIFQLPKFLKNFLSKSSALVRETVIHLSVIDLYLIRVEHIRISQFILQFHHVLIVIKFLKIHFLGTWISVLVLLDLFATLNI